MVQKDFNCLDKNIKRVSHSLQELFTCIDDILSRDNKAFDINFLDKEYVFHPPSTCVERNRMQIKRKELIHKILKKCSRDLISKLQTSLSKSLKDDDIVKCWEMVFAFSMGEDPRNHQFKKDSIKGKDIKDVVANHEVGTLGVQTIPLDQESAHIKHQNPNLYIDSAE
jgi:hypothetical protein